MEAKIWSIDSDSPRSRATKAVIERRRRASGGLDGGEVKGRDGEETAKNGAWLRRETMGLRDNIRSSLERLKVEPKNTEEVGLAEAFLTA